MPPRTPLTRTRRQTLAPYATDRFRASAFPIILILFLSLGWASCSNSSRSNNTLAILKAPERHVLVISVDGLSAEFLSTNCRRAVSRLWHG